MKISIGADHRGFAFKQHLIKALPTLSWIDVGAHDDVRSDYPVFAKKVCGHMLEGAAELGILLCGSGIGMAITANRFPRIYAAVCWNVEIARVSREDDGSNVLVLPADFIDEKLMVAIVQAWLQATFKQGRYQQRLSMIDQ